MAKKANETKASKNKSAKKPNWFVRRWRAMRSWAHDMKIELKKVHWPSRQDVVKNCLSVLVCVLVVGVCVWVFDAVAAAVIRALIDLFQV